MISMILVGLTFLFLIANLVYFFVGHRYEQSYFQSSLFQKLFFTMTALTVGFGFLYYVMSFETTVLRVSTEDGREGGESFLDYLYFSGVTMLSVGYGDLVPVGSARFFALLQAGIGLLLPTAYFVRALNEHHGKNKEESDVKEGQGNYSDKRGKDEEDEEETEEAEEIDD